MKNLHRSATLAVLFASAAFATPALAVTDTALERLCYVKSQDAPVAYNAEAKRFGISKHQLKKLESDVKCNGVPLGNVENQWVKRNPK